MTIEPQILTQSVEGWKLFRVVRNLGTCINIRLMAFVYSCCFWFSLRLGGILIGSFSLIQALLMLAAFCYAYTHTKQIEDWIMDLTTTLDLVYMKHALENFQTDPTKYSSLGITLSGIYLVVCLLFIYGAYTCNNILMILYLLMEFIRLVLLSVIIANFLLLLKQNTMDIGVLIGASVAGGFFLLGMFYLWVCTVNLPLLVNEIQLDEHEATINKLQLMLESNSQRTFADRTDLVPLAAGGNSRNNMFIVSRNRSMPRQQS